MTLAQYFKIKSKQMDRIILRSVRKSGLRKPDGSRKGLFPDDFADGFTKRDLPK